MRTAILSILIGALLGSCVSPPSGSGGSSGQKSAMAGTPARVSLIQYGQVQRLNLVNEAHTDPVEYYSEKRTSASTKITSNEVLAAMLEYFDERGFSTYAREGYAPRQGAPGERSSLEVETEAGVQHLLFAQGQSQPALEAFIECQQAWLEVYNMTVQAQAVTNSGGGFFFEKQKAKIAKDAQDR